MAFGSVLLQLVKPGFDLVVPLYDSLDVCKDTTTGMSKNLWSPMVLVGVQHMISAELNSQR